MNQNLKRLEKELRNFAKRCKNVKYTKALLLSFLMSGVLSFGVASSRKGELDSIKNAKDKNWRVWIAKNIHSARWRRMSTEL